MSNRGRSVFVRLIKYLLRRWPLLLASTIAVITYAYAISLEPMLLRYAIDYGVSRGDLNNAVRYSLMILGVAVLGGLSWYVTRDVTARLSQGLAHDLRVKAFAAVHMQSMEFFDRVAAGQLISKITNDTNRLARVLSWQVRNVINLSFTAGISLYYMFTMSPRLSYIVLAALALMAVVNAKYTTTIRPIYDGVRQQLGVLASIVTSNLNGIKTVKSLTLEETEINRFRRENNKFADLNLKAAKVRALYGNASQLILGVSMASVLYYGGYAVSTGVLSVGELTAFITYLSLLMWPMRAFGFMLSATQRALAAASRIFEIIDVGEAPKQRRGVRPASLRGEIVFDSVTFSYVKGKPVLKNVSFRVKPGEKLFLAGPPGSGKSTILKLILRFYEPDYGSVRIDGVDVREIDLDLLRGIVAYVPQEPFIFSGSIKENILFGNPNASIDDVVKVAKIAKIHGFIESLPQGYDTPVGERGITLSGGQKQRIAIARALLKDPRIMLLDDPVSNLDSETERYLVKDLKEILKGRTVIMVSQRPSLATLADRVIVLENGRIVDEGTHEELLRRSTPYRKLWATEEGGN